MSFNRAGTTALKAYYKKELELLRTTHLNLSQNVEQKELDENAQAVYYSHWLYGAVHMLSLFDNINSVLDISKRLNISLQKAETITQFLLRHGILTRNKLGHLEIGETNLHLKQGSPFLTRHQINWRLQSILNIEEEKKAGDIHYSALISMSKADSEQIKEKIIQLIDNNLKQIKDSKDEVLFCSIFDFYEF